MTKNRTSLDLYVEQSVKKYIDFMRLEKFPQYELSEKIISQENANKRGFGSFASHYYDTYAGKHTLEVWPEIYHAHLNAEYLLFHEFTHILDSETYAYRDKTKYVMSKGYLEYHAGQIDLLKILDYEKINDVVSFSMNQSFETVSNRKTVEEFVAMAHNTATELIEKNNFPSDVETLATTFGMIFNYWGRRSICKMYATNYVESVNNDAIEAFFGVDSFRILNCLMNGWLPDFQIERVGEIYLNMVILKMNEYSL